MDQFRHKYPQKLRSYIISMKTKFENENKPEQINEVSVKIETKIENPWHK